MKNGKWFLALGILMAACFLLDTAFLVVNGLSDDGMAFWQVMRPLLFAFFSYTNFVRYFRKRT